MNFPIFGQDEQPKELRSSSATTPTTTEEKARVKKSTMEKDRVTADYLAKDETKGGFRNLNDEAESIDDPSLKIKNDKPEDAEDVLIKHDAPEGSLTWSMQSEEGGNAPKPKKIRKATDDGGRTLEEPAGSTRPATQSADLVTEKNPVTASKAAASGAGSPLAAEPAPDLAKEKNESWLETVRRVLARIFS